MGRFDQVSQTGDYHQIYETVNELCFAKLLIDRNDNASTIFYEPILKKTDKKVDFLSISPEGNRIYFELKTVSPRNQEVEKARSDFEKLKPYNLW